MKTKLLSLSLIMVLFSSISNAQTKTWDFGNNTTTWPLSSGIGSEEIIVDNLGLYPIATNTNFGAVTANNATFTDGFTATQRFQMNGGGSAPAGTFMPVQRFLHFNVSGACTVKVWFKTGSGGATRTIFVTNGSALVGSATSNSGGNTDAAIVTASYTGGAGKLYIYGDSACNLYKVEVTGATVTAATLGTDDFKAGSTVKVYSTGKQIYVSNVLSDTQVDVYSMTGALVKSIKTNSDTNFDFLNAGVYIVKVKSVEGEKSVKVAIQ